MSETWRPVPGFPYSVSSRGRVRNSEGAELRAHVWHDGYARVSLWRRGKGHTKRVHRLVCEAFHGSPPFSGMDAAHRNGLRTDNRADNLRWATRQQNEHDKRAMGRDNAGSRNGHAKLTEYDVRIILCRIRSLPRSSGGARFKKGSLPALAAEYGVTAAAVRNILAGTHWRTVTA